MTATRRVRGLTVLPVALIVGVGALTGCSAFLPGEPPPVTNSTTGAEITQQNADVFQLEVGQCLNDSSVDAGEVQDVPSVSCDAEHDSEVYYVFDLPEGDFDAGAVSDGADTGCEAQFASYVGLGFDESQFTYSSYTPTAGSWSSVDREVACVLLDPNGEKITGSLKDAAR